MTEVKTISKKDSKWKSRCKSQILSETTKNYGSDPVCVSNEFSRVYQGI